MNSPPKNSKTKSTKQKTAPESVFSDPSLVLNLPSPNSRSLLNSAMIALDSSVLLLPYDIRKESIEEIGHVFRSAIRTDRLVIPAQSVREFGRRRSRKLADVCDRIDKDISRISEISSVSYPFLEQTSTFEKLKDQRREINQSITAYRHTLQRMRDEILSWMWDDPVSLIYRDLVPAEKIVDVSIGEENLRSEIQRRIQHNIPPGYKDSKKPDEGIGDLLIWETLIEIANKHNSDIVFVTHDLKEDWWHRASGKPHFVRFELAYEFYIRTNGRKFATALPSDFFRHFGAGRSVVSSIERTEHATHRRSKARNSSRVIINSVINWFHYKYGGFAYEPDVSSSLHDIGVDVVSGDVGGATVGAVVKVCSPESISDAVSRFSSMVDGGLVEKAGEAELDNIHLILISRDGSPLPYPPDLGTKISGGQIGVFAGFVDDGGVFHETYGIVFDGQQVISHLYSGNIEQHESKDIER